MDSSLKLSLPSITMYERIFSMKINHDHLRILSKIQDFVLEAGAKETTVAGGAIRDMLLEKDIKDIDVFYVGDLDSKVLEKHFTTNTDEEEVNAYEDSTFEVYPTVSMEGCSYPIQLIKVKTTVGDLDQWIVDTFGCNLSKVLYGSNLVLTQEFLDDAEMEILTFPNPVEKNYMDKMTAKFPDFLVNGEVKNDSSFDF
jgi:hypothetical protein